MAKLCCVIALCITSFMLSVVPFYSEELTARVKLHRTGSVEELQDPLNISILDGDVLKVRFRSGSAPLNSSDLAGGGLFEQNF